MNKLFSSSLIMLVIMAVLMLGQTAQATSSVMLNDEQLITSSRVIIIGEVVSVSSQWSEDDRIIYSYIKFSVEEDLKGNVSSRTIVLKQIGGVLGDTEMVYFGSPVFKLGQRMLLFLNPASDGTLHVAHLFQGKFDISAKGHVTRELKESGTIIQSVGGDYTYSALLETFREKVGSILSAQTSNKPEQSIIEIPFEYRDGISHEPGFDIQFVTSGRRWLEPDTGQTIYFYVNSDNAPIEGGGIAQVELALAAWSNVPSASIVLGYGGPTGTRGFRADGVSTISFGDPFDQMSDPVQCVGVIAIGGYVRTGSSGQIVEGDVVLNRNFECTLGNSANLAEVICHEVGHTIGLDHSNVTDAIMRSYMYGKGRGATLGQDDIAGITAIYPGPKVEQPRFDNAVFISQSVPQTMVVGQSYTVTLVFQNSGNGKWKPGKGYYLGSQSPQGNMVWGTQVVPLGGKVKAGRQVELTFQVTAPAYPGLYYFQWGMERNGQQFGQPSPILLVNVVSQ